MVAERCTLKYDEIMCFRALCSFVHCFI